MIDSAHVLASIPAGLRDPLLESYKENKGQKKIAYV